jgi:RHS repeat-associated protein
VTKYTYVPGTNLVKTKTLCDRETAKITYIYDYDQDLLLVSETIDDGVTKKFKKITPRQEQPFLGMPEVLDEKYWNGFKEVLLKKTAVHYGPGALIVWKNIYNENAISLYQLYYEYDEKKRVVGETNPLGQKAIFKYDELGNRYYQRSFNDLVETNSKYDFCNRLIENEEIADGISRKKIYSYDTKHNLEFELDERGNQTSYKYNFLGQRIETELPPIPLDTGELVIPVIKQVYDNAGNEILRIDAEGNETHTTYNAYNKPILIVHPDGAKEQFFYSSHDLTGKIQTHIDPLGVETSYVYDYLGRVLKKRISSHGKILSQETYEYEGYQLMVKTDAEGNKTVYTYDQAGRKTSETFAEETTEFFYDFCGRQHKVQKGDLVTVFIYDLMDRIIEERKESALGEVLRKTQYRFDDVTNRKTVIQFIGEKEEKEVSTYDAWNRLIEKTNAKGFTETIFYGDVVNDYGQKVLQKIHTDAMGLQTIETFDTHNRSAKIEKRKEKTLALTEKFYTKNGNLSSQLDTIFSSDGCRQSRVQWQYDQRGRLITLIEAEGTADAKITRKTYTLRGELEQIIKPDKVEVFYKYNELGQLILISSSDQTVYHQMSYNRLGHLQTTDDLIRVTDPLGRVIAETFPQGYSVFNLFDFMGNRASCHIPAANCLIEYKYHTADLRQVTRKTNDGKELYSHHYKKRDLSGNLWSEQLINENLVNHEFDEMSRRTSIQTSLFFQEILKFDAVGNILQMQIQKDEIDYDYDELYQLIGESGPFAHDYVYDSLHNRLAKDQEAYEINALHQVTSHLKYDRNGNPTQQNETTYVYDALDRLIEIQTPTMVQTFTYDSFHRCLSKTVRRDKTVEVLHFIYDGQNEIGSFDEQLILQELRILGNAMHAEIGASVAIELQGKIFAPIHDLQGNITALVPLDASASSFYRYSAFGEEKVEGPTLSPWRFSSKRSDAATGLVYYGRRFYMPLLGRWLTPDPAGFTDGMNLYAFLSNDPLIKMDLYGLTGFDADSFRKFSWPPSPEQRFFADTSPKGFQFNNPWSSSLLDSFSNNRSAIFPPLNFFSSGSPHFVVNGILNSASSHFQSARVINATFEGQSNIIPAYSESFGKKDLVSVGQVIYFADYTSDFIRKFSRELEFVSLCMDLLGDPRKIFISAFSRGVAETYFATKDLPQNVKNRLIITALGGILIIPRSCGFITQNLISEGDRASKMLNGISNDPEERAEMLKMHRRDANVQILKQIDSSGINEDHFIQSKTYQKGLQDHVVETYKKHGFLK